LTHQGYVKTGIETTGLHQIIMNCVNDKLIIDHNDLNRLNNRKSNLRYATHSQNHMNTRIQPNNTSGVRGVTWDKNNNQWMARIKINNKQIHLGRYNIFEDAVNTRKKAEDMYFKEFKYKEVIHNE